MLAPPSLWPTSRLAACLAGAGIVVGILIAACQEVAPRSSPTRLSTAGEPIGTPAGGGSRGRSPADGGDRPAGGGASPSQEPGNAGATSGTPASTRDATVWPFAAESPWNTSIGSGARYQGLGGACTDALQDRAVAPWINTVEWSHPIYRASASDPLVPIFSVNPEEQGLVATTHVPADARYARPDLRDNASTDAHLHVLEPGGRFLHEMWRAFPRAEGGWTTEYHVRTDLYGPGVGEGGVRAYGGSAIGGLIRQGELRRGIPHALAFAMPISKQKRGFVWPASAEDDQTRVTYTGPVPMGTLVAIPPDVRLDGLDPPLGSAGMAIARALQDYGAYDVDSGGGYVLYAEPSEEPEVLPLLEGDEIARVWYMVRCVENNTPQTPGGGGVRRAPPAPPLATNPPGR